MPDLLTLVAAVVVGVLGTARLVRLTSADSFPPVLKVRLWWQARFEESDWYDLGDCPFCQAPYISAVTIGWAWLSDLHWSWFVFYSWMSLAYVAAIVVSRETADGE